MDTQPRPVELLAPIVRFLSTPPPFSSSHGACASLLRSFLEYGELGGKWMQVLCPISIALSPVEASTVWAGVNGRTTAHKC